MSYVNQFIERYKAQADFVWWEKGTKYPSYQGELIEPCDYFVIFTENNNFNISSRGLTAGVAKEAKYAYEDVSLPILLAYKRSQGSGSQFNFYSTDITRVSNGVEIRSGKVINYFDLVPNEDFPEGLDVKYEDENQKYYTSSPCNEIPLPESISSDKKLNPIILLIGK